ncbi:MAG: aquaporin [Candidatus Nanopelagicales bacterium]
MTINIEPGPGDAATKRWRRLFAEFWGTALLVTAVVGSGIAAASLTTDVGLQLLINALATVSALGVLIWVLGPISGAHFNPAVSLVAAARREVSLREAAGYLVVQLTGAFLGVALANVMFDLPAWAVSTQERSGAGLWIGEIVATAGLLLVIGALTRTGRAHLGPILVPAWIGAAYFFASSTSFANPAVTFGRVFTDTFTGITPTSAVIFVVCQLIGAAIGAAMTEVFYPRKRPAPLDLPAPVHDPRPRTVLFACVHNSGRSQIAAGFLRAMGGSRFVVLSAGSQPGDAVNEVAMAAMAEVGLDISGHPPRLLTDTDVREADAVVTMGCGDTCPVYPGKTYQDWQVDDPKDQSLETVRVIRDDIRRRVAMLIQQLQ